MTLTLPLSKEQQLRLEVKARASGLSVEEYALRQLFGESQKLLTGAQIVEELRAEGILGTFSDRPDSPQWARQLREEAAKRSS